MAKKSRRQPLRSHKIPPAALATGKALMDDQDRVTRRYNEWSVDTVAAMNIGDPREGHIWLVDPTKGTVTEAPHRR